jgi:hypothetical protein
MIHRMLSPLALLPLLAACGKEPEVQEFPPGLTMLEDLAVECPGGGTPEKIEVKSGEGDDFDWSHGCGYVHASIEDVYLALLDSEVAVDQRSVDVWDRTDGVQPEYENSFALWNTVNDIITIEYETTWRYGALASADDASLEKVGGRYQMTIEPSPSVISLMEGSVQAQVVEDDVTKLMIIDHLSALRGGTDITDPKVRDLFEDVVAHVHGEAIPSHRDE